MNSRERFLAAARCEATDRPPVWIMRQAGRYLPEYRALKERHDFLTLVKTPELAAEVTLQPVRRFDTLDAAITFSDILVIPEALGQNYRFGNSGIAMEFTLDSAEQIRRLAPADAVYEKLAYVPAAQKIVREQLGSERALLGFAGTPWTLATYMVEGGSAKQFSQIKALAAEKTADFNALMEKLSDAVIAYLKMQIDAGVDAVQLFDSWASLCTAQEYETLSLRWIHKIIAALPAQIPVIVFAKGMSHFAAAVAQTGARVLGADWTRSLSDIRKSLPAGTRLALQGNLDPAVLNFENPQIVRERTRAILDEMRGDNGFIFNLGHGIQPCARIKNVAAMLEEIRHAQR